VGFDSESQTSAWIRISVQFNQGTIASLGAPGTRNFRSFGIVFVEIYTPVGGGKSPNTVLATTARNVFRGVQLSGGLWFRDASITHVGPEATWYHQNVVVEFIFDEDE
jgi:hypothetical protein